MTALSIHAPTRCVYPSRMDIEEIGRIVVDSGYRVHRALGPGLLEKVYLQVYARDLVRCGLSVEVQKPISFDFEGMWFENACTADIVVERKVAIELKSVMELKPVHYKQLLTYMRLLGCPLGYLINFKTALFKDGVKRLVL